MSKPEWLLAAPISASNNKANTKLFPFLVRLIKGGSLHFTDAEDFFLALTDQNANTAQIAASLAAITSKGETAEEIAGMASAMYQTSVKIESRFPHFINISGTGASLAKTFNVSTAASFVASGAGLPVAKHTGRGTKSQCGGADVLEKLKIGIAVEPKVAQACLNGAGIAFLFPAKFHTSSRRLKETSRNLGFMTCINLLEALACPANAPMQLIGVWHPSMILTVSKALRILQTQCSWVVHGSDGLDELTLTGETFVTEIRGKSIKNFTVKPEDFGLKAAAIEHLKVESPQASAKIIREVIENKRRDEARSLVVLNAAAALLIGGIAKEPKKAARLAEQSIDSGSALSKLERLITVTNKI